MILIAQGDIHATLSTFHAAAGPPFFSRLIKSRELYDVSPSTHTFTRSVRLGGRGRSRSSRRTDLTVASPHGTAAEGRLQCLYRVVRKDNYNGDENAFFSYCAATEKAEWIRVRTTLSKKL